MKSTISRAAMAIARIAISPAVLATAAAAQTGTTPLHLWFDPGRGDNFTTAAPGWQGASGQAKSPSYRWVGIEGRALGPGTTPMPGLLPLDSWFSNQRKDNYTTAQAGWLGGPGQTRSPDYRWFRREGYLFANPVAGTIPLASWFSPSRGDNVLTSQPEWIPTGAAGETRSPDYAHGRIEGWILPPVAGALAREEDPARFGFGARPVLGTIPLLVVTTQTSDSRLTQPDSFYRRMVFGPGFPNIVDYFSAMSLGRFTFSNAGQVRVSLSTTAQAINMQGVFDSTVMAQVVSQGFNFASFDRNRDGTVSTDELAVLFINSTQDVDGDGRLDFWGSGQTRNFGPVRAGSVVLSSIQVSACDEQGDIKLFAHELLHQITRDTIANHSYGPGNRLNRNATVFAVQSNRGAPDDGPVGLDPYTAMVYGWVRPRVVPITLAGGTATVSALQHLREADAGAPILFYDPARGDREFFVIQYRTPATATFPAPTYDQRVVNQGIAVWHVHRNPSGALLTFNWPPPYAAHVANGDMFSNYYIGPDGPSDGGFFPGGSVSTALKWGDGTDSGLRIGIGPLSVTAPAAEVVWYNARSGFLGRIDRVSPAAVTAGEVVTLEGAFPVAPMPLRIGVARRGDTSVRWPVRDILNRSSTRIVMRVPAGIPAGDVQVAISSSHAAIGGLGNWAPLSIR